MVFGSVAISFRCAFLRGIECFLLRKNISNFAEAIRDKRFTTMTPLGTVHAAKCYDQPRFSANEKRITFLVKPLQNPRSSHDISTIFSR